MYHCVETCNKCNGNNDLINPRYGSHFLHETRTICNECNHTDYWAYGYFESSNEGLNECDKYYFDVNYCFQRVSNGEE